MRFFIDFDGTITKTDVIDAILENFADPSWRAVEKEWVEGKIGSRECLRRQLDLVSTSFMGFESLVDHIEVDEHFIDFLKTARAAEVPVIIVSDGLTEVIKSVLKRHLADDPELIAGLPVFANHINWGERGPRLAFSLGVCAHGCANCKEAVIRAHSKPGEKILFVGDGLSDRYAARTAHLTFAKNKLLNYCRDNGIEHIAYSDFAQINAWLKENQKANIRFLPVWLRTSLSESSTA